jgi:phage shock protein PspC (stress-responsive transcriptional regulator)
MRSQFLPARAARGPTWWGLAGVALLLAMAMVPVSFVAIMGLYAATWEVMDSPEGPPRWLEALFVVVTVAPAVVPGLVVGWVAGLRRGWLVPAAALSAAGAIGTYGLAAFTFSEDLGARFGPVAAVPGMVAGSLLAVLAARRLGGGGAGIAGEVGADRRRPTRSREGRLIAGVCSGWARARGYDVAPVRVVAVGVVVADLVFVRILAPLLLLLYAIAWLTWPLDEPGRKLDEPARTPDEPTPAG